MLKPQTGATLPVVPRSELPSELSTLQMPVALIQANRKQCSVDKAHKAYTSMTEQCKGLINLVGCQLGAHISALVTVPKQSKPLNTSGSRLAEHTH